MMVDPDLRKSDMTKEYDDCCFPKQDMSRWAMVRRKGQRGSNICWEASLSKKNAENVSNVEKMQKIEKNQKKLLTFPQIYIILTYVIETRRGSVW